MTQINWKDNNNMGGFVERQLRALKPHIDKAEGDRKIQLLQKLVYIMSLKEQIAKPSKQEEELEALREELKEVRAILALKRPEIQR